MIYSKLPLDYSEILDLLVSRGLIISDRNKAIECLKVVSYFRLDNYFHPMESDKVRHISNLVALLKMQWIYIASIVVCANWFLQP